MKELQAKLDPDLFIRIHRSVIVNTDKIRELQPWFHGDFVVVLKSGKKFTSGRAYRKRILEQISNQT